MPLISSPRSASAVWSILLYSETKAHRCGMEFDVKYIIARRFAPISHKSVPPNDLFL